MMLTPGLYHILSISAALFFIGVYGFLTRRNLITMLMSIELILNSVNLNFIAFNKYVWPEKMDGLFFTIFIIAIAAAEAAAAVLAKGKWRLDSPDPEAVALADLRVMHWRELCAADALAA